MKFTKVLLISMFSGLLIQSGGMMLASDVEIIKHVILDTSEKKPKSFGQRLKSSACQSFENAVKWSVPTALVCTAIYFTAVKPLTISMNELGKDLRSYESSLTSLADSFGGLKDSFGKVSISFDKLVGFFNFYPKSTMELFSNGFFKK